MTLRDLCRTCLLTATATLTLGAANAQFVQVAAGVAHGLALDASGKITAWGESVHVPELPAGVTWVAVAAGGAQMIELGGPMAYSLGLRSDGEVVAWGNGWFVDLSDVPALPPGLTYTDIAMGSLHALALRSDGEVVAWGDDSVGQCDVPALPPGVTYVEITAGGSSWEKADFCPFWPEWTGKLRGMSLARRSDGAVVAWGYGGDGVLSVPPLPPGVEYVEVDAGGDHAIARRSDGTVVAWGDNAFGQCDVPALPAGLSVSSVSAGGGYSAAVLSDGSIMAWGIDLPAAAPWTPYVEAPPLPPGLEYLDISVGGARGYIGYWDGDDFSSPCEESVYEHASPHMMALRSDGAVVAWGDNSLHQVIKAWWENLGGGTEGVAGPPRLFGNGMPSEGESVRVSLFDAPPSALALLSMSPSSAPFAALGGTFHATPAGAEILMTAGVSGYATLWAEWPAGIPVDTEFWFQFVVQDGSVASGLTLSNGLKLKVP